MCTDRGVNVTVIDAQTNTQLCALRKVGAAAGDAHRLRIVATHDADLEQRGEPAAVGAQHSQAAGTPFSPPRCVAGRGKWLAASCLARCVRP